MTSTNTIITIFLPLIQLSLSLGLTSCSSGGNLTTSTPIPSYPTIQSPAAGANLTCHLDLSSELFGGVSTACSSSSSPLDRDRCCPVLAAWLFAAHARSALSISSSPVSSVSSPLSDDVLPLMPDDSQKCVDSLHASLEQRNIKLPRPNDTCDTVLCFCGIRLHQIGSLSCPAAFNVTVNATGGRAGVDTNATSSVATPTAAVKQLEKECRNSSYAGCTRCLQSLEKLKAGKSSSKVSTTNRAAKMFNRDCQLMGLTWLLAKNKTLYIPTVSAVLRAVLYSTQPYKCRADQENMPLAVDSLQFQKLDSSSAAAASSPSFALEFLFYSLHVLLIALFLCGAVPVRM